MFELILGVEAGFGVSDRDVFAATEGLITPVFAAFVKFALGGLFELFDCLLETPPFESPPQDDAKTVMPNKSMNSDSFIANSSYLFELVAAVFGTAAGFGVLAGLFTAGVGLAVFTAAFAALA